MALPYAVWGPNTSGTGPATMISLTAIAGFRPKLYDMMVGSGVVATDYAMVVGLSRHTAAGTATAYTPLPFDAVQSAAVTVAGITHTVEPTVASTAHLMQVGLNQRSTFRYVCPPGFEFTLTAGAATGLSWRLITATTALVMVGTTYHFE